MVELEVGVLAAQDEPLGPGAGGSDGQEPLRGKPVMDAGKFCEGITSPSTFDPLDFQAVKEEPVSAEEVQSR